MGKNMATSLTTTTVKTVLDKYEAIATQGTSTTNCFYFYTGEYGWSAYADNLTTDTMEWIHSTDGLIVWAYDNGSHLYLANNSGGLSSGTDDDGNDNIVWFVGSWVTNTADMDSAVYATYLKWRAGYDFDDDTGDVVFNDYDTDVYDYIVGCQDFNLYDEYLNKLDSDGDADTDTVDGTKNMANLRRYLDSEEGMEAQEFFNVWYSDQTEKTTQLFKNYMEAKYKPHPGSAGDIVFGEYGTYNMPVPDNLWPCDGTTITNEKAIPQLYGKAAPDYSGMTMACVSTTYTDGDTGGSNTLTLEADNLPEISGSWSMTPSGTVSASQSSHSHSYTSKFRYMYKVLRDSDDVSDNTASDSGNYSSTAENSNTIESGHDDNLTFYWDRFSISGTTGSKTPTITATFTGTESTGTSVMNGGTENSAIDVRQPTIYKQAYIVIY